MPMPFVSDIIRSAGSSIILLDNYVDDTVLTLLGKRNDKCNCSLSLPKVSVTSYGWIYNATTANIL